MDVISIFLPIRGYVKKLRNDYSTVRPLESEVEWRGCRKIFFPCYRPVVLLFFNLFVLNPFRILLNFGGGCASFLNLSIFSWV